MLWVRGVNGFADGLSVNFLVCLSTDVVDVSADDPVVDTVDDALIGRIAREGFGGADCGGVGCWSGTCWWGEVDCAIRPGEGVLIGCG